MGPKGGKGGLPLQPYCISAIFQPKGYSVPTAFPMAGMPVAPVGSFGSEPLMSPWAQKKQPTQQGLGQFRHTQTRRLHHGHASVSHSTDTSSCSEFGCASIAIQSIQKPLSSCKLRWSFEKWQQNEFRFTAWFEPFLLARSMAASVHLLVSN